MDPYDMLPIEMWEEILDTVQDPLDKLSLVETNSMLDNAFQHCKPKWKFAGVVSILLKNWYEPYDLASFRETDVDRLEFLFENQALLFSGLRNCRAVNNLTCRVVNSYIEEYWEKFCSAPSFVTPSWSRPQQIVQFLEQLNDFPPNQNPILSRTVSGYCHFEEEPGFFHNIYPTDRQMLDLIGRVGQNLRMLNLILIIPVENAPRICNFVQEALSSTPNLRNLEVFRLRMQGEVTPPASLDVVVPDLPQLEEINVEDFHPERVPWIPACINLKKYFPQLKKLSLGYLWWLDDYNHNKGQILFPKLESLEFMYLNICDQQEMLFNFLYNLNAPMLKRAELNCPRRIEIERLDDSRKAVYFIKTLGLLALRETSRVAYASGDVYRKVMEGQEKWLSRIIFTEEFEDFVM